MRSPGRVSAGALVLSATLSGCVSPPSRLGAFTPPPSPRVSTAPPSSTAARLLNEARGFVYRVRSVACLAVGSSFNTDYGIITNRHVAQGSGTLQLSTWDGTDFEADVDAISRGPDLALLSTAPGQGQATARIDPSQVAPGTPIWVAGYPEGNQLSVTRGIAVRYVSAKWIGQPEKVLEITAAVRHGDSGGPVFNAAGEVVAVVFALERTGHDAIAVPASSLARFVDAPGYHTDFPCLE